MELKDQVTNLELSKKLKELGFKQESLFWWGEEENLANAYLPRICTNLSHWDDENMIPVCAAFTVAELGKMLPWDIVIARNIDREWIVTFQADGLPENKIYSWQSVSLAESVAQVLIHLTKQGTITPPEL